MQRFKRFVHALTTVMPYSQIPRFPSGLAYCVEVSTAGAAALREHGVAAEAIFCAVVASHPQRGVHQIIGLNADHARRMVPGFGVQGAVGYLSSEAATMDYPVHCIIRAGGSDGYAFIDLTAGQLWVSGIDVPLSLVQFSEMWSLPTFRLNGGGSVRYLPCPYEDKVDRSLFNQPRPNFVDDVTDLIHIAVDCDFDLERVESVISEQFPDDHAFTQSRLRSFRLPLK